MNQGLDEFYGHCSMCGQPATTMGFLCGCKYQPSPIPPIPEDLQARWAELNTWVRGPVNENTEMPNEIGRLSELLLIERIAHAETALNEEIAERDRCATEAQKLIPEFNVSGGPSEFVRSIVTETRERIAKLIEEVERLTKERGLYARGLEAEEADCEALHDEIANLTAANEDNAEIGRQALRRLEEMVKINDNLEAENTRLKAALDEIRLGISLNRDSREETLQIARAAIKEGQNS